MNYEIKYEFLMSKEDFKIRIKNYTKKEQMELIDFMYDCVNREINKYRKLHEDLYISYSLEKSYSKEG